MARVYFAWSRIVIAGKQPNTTDMILPGDKVTRDMVGVDWSDLIAGGSIRTEPYPKDIRIDESPRNAKLRLVNETLKQMNNSFENPEDDEE